VTAITPGILFFDASSGCGQRGGWPVHSKEHVMRSWWKVAICAGAGGVIGTVVGDWYSVSHTVGRVLASAGTGIGAVIGAILTPRPVGADVL